jgi:phytol kinase
MLANPWIALIITFALSLLWLRFNDYLAHRGVISGPLSRKIIHMGTGPLFVACWLLYPPVALSRYLAALVPLAITVQFALVGLGIMKDQAAVDAMSRHGDRTEILRGPLFYGIVFVILTISFWKDSPIGIIALMLLCGGDGLADIAGKRYGTVVLWWSKNKTWAGMLGMFVGGWIFAVGIMALYVAAGVFPGTLEGKLIPITIITVVGTLVETLPYRDIDNLTVPAVAVLLGYLLHI